MQIKRIISVIIALVLICLTCVACNSEKKEDAASGSSSAVSETEKFKLTHADSVVKFDNETDVVICWGDSLTQGMSMAPGYTYPQQLQGNIKGQFKVINAGVPGETSNAISSRANVIDTVLTNDITFEKGKNSVDLDREFLSTANGEVITYKGFGNDLALDKIIIGGETFDIIFKKGTSWDEGIYTLVRKSTDVKLTLKKGTAIKFDYSLKYKTVYCNVILMGANDSGVSVDELINRYKTLGGTSDKNIYIIPYYTEENVAEKFKAAFGDNALDMREYYINHAHKDYDLEVTKLDEWCIKKGKVPATFCLENDKNDCHLSSIGYKVMADQVYKKGVKLGFWK
ncbi:MAG: hypothetical protein E7526_06290 [Ruminococcaceae bacterium]|nr:hypothetical protein [Oscillospiraceae bacterium]